MGNETLVVELYHRRNGCIEYLYLRQLYKRIEHPGKGEERDEDIRGLEST